MEFKKHFIMFKSTIILSLVTIMLFTINLTSDLISNFMIIGIILSIRTFFMYIKERNVYNKYTVIEYEDNFNIHRGDEFFVLYKENIKTKTYKYSRFLNVLTIYLTYEVKNSEDDSKTHYLEFVLTGLKNKKV